jgi:hypothetical protein
MILREIPFEINDLTREYNQDISDERRAEIEHQLDALEIEFSRKADAIADFIADYKSQAEFIDQEIDRLKVLKSQRERQAEQCSRYLANALMRQTDGEPLVTPYHRFSFRTSQTVQLRDDANIPLQYCREIPARLEPQKPLIREALQRGESMDGAWLQTRNILQIR